MPAMLRPRTWLRLLYSALVLVYLSSFLSSCRFMNNVKMCCFGKSHMHMVASEVGALPAINYSDAMFMSCDVFLRVKL